MKSSLSIEALESALGEGRVAKGKNIALYITLRTQTIAQYYFEARSREELINAVCAAYELSIPLLIIGGGSNLAIMQSTIDGLVVRNQYHQMKGIAETSDSVDLLVSSGYPVGRLVRDTVSKGYSGFEYQLGLPGTAGGAIFMNSKWTKPISYFGDPLISATLIDQNGTTKEVDRDYFQFAYDFSILQKTKEIIVDAVFRLKKMDPVVLKKRSEEALAYRKQTQPFGVATSGCFFRNISKEDQNRLNLATTSAGYLIDQTGLKNMKMGEYIVSDKHANFIINTGHGNTEDLMKLTGIIKERVKNKFGVELEEEVVII